MFLLPPFLRQFFIKKQKDAPPRTYLSDDQLLVRIKQIAVDEQRPEQDVYDEILKAAAEAVQHKKEYAAIWDTLSGREQQVTALLCLGYRSYEIADMLYVSYETVRSHSKHVYAKFGLNRKQLCLALQDWNFQEWLESSDLGGK